eukprot:1294798-Amphidinium_carterae.1
MGMTATDNSKATREALESPVNIHRGKVQAVKEYVKSDPLIDISVEAGSVSVELGTEQSEGDVGPSAQCDDSQKRNSYYHNTVHMNTKDKMRKDRLCSK